MDTSISERMRAVRAKKPMISVQDRFWGKVSKRSVGECWTWSGALTTDGYGILGLGKREEGNVLSHRYSYILHRGEIVPGLEIDHLCRNRACVNPWHLETVTRRTNWIRGASPSAIKYKIKNGVRP